MNKYLPGTLETLLKEDGVVLKGDGEERKCQCFSPHHDDKNPSMYVNVNKNVYNCFGCKISGTPYTYLHEIRGWDHEDVQATLRDRFGWSKERFEHSYAAHKKQEGERSDRSKGRELKWVEKPSEHNLVCWHRYRNADGQLVVLVGRYLETDPKRVKKKAEEGKNPPKRCTPYIKCKEERGGFWVAWPLNKQLPPAQRIDKRIPYRLPELLETPASAKVWIVEGESCVDSVLANKPESQELACTTIMGAGTTLKAIGEADLSYFAGRKCLLLADTDKEGRKFMTTLGQHLVAMGVETKMILPEGEGAYDIADAIRDGGWENGLKWLNGIGLTEVPDKEAQDFEADDDAVTQMLDNPEFKVLGMMPDQRVAVMNKTSYMTFTFPPAQMHREGTLQTIASNAFWSDYGGLGNSAKRRSYASTIIQAAYSQGIIDIEESMIGRGAYRVRDGRIVWNLGNRIAMPDDKGLLSKEVPLGDADISMAPGRLVRTKHSADAPKYAKELYEALEGYRWQSPRDFRCFAGWIVSSLVGGALDFRTMLWLLAPAESGKTFLWDPVLVNVLGDTLHYYSDTTAAGLVQDVSSASVPVIYDELEPSEGVGVDLKMQAILGAVRQATSGRGSKSRGTPTGVSIKARPRFSLIASSINLPRLNEADASRFVLIRLSEYGVADWEGLEKKIRSAIDIKKMLTVRTWIIRNTSAIAERARELASDMRNSEREISTRQSMIFGALTAGAGWLSGDYEIILPAGARAKENRYGVLETILGTTIRIHGQNDQTLGEILHHAFVKVREEPEDDFGVIDNIRLGRRYGLEMIYDFENKTWELHVAHSLPTLQSLLKNTRWSNIELREYLMTLPGSYTPKLESGHIKRMFCAGVQKPVIAVSDEVLKLVGLVK